MLDLYTPSQVATLDRAAMKDGGIPGEVLMERAGRRVWHELRRRWPQAARIAVVCGGGHNGGDGYVVARLARQAGRAVQVLELVEPERLSGEAAGHARRYREAGGMSQPFDRQALAGVEVIVDAVFGTGLDRPVEGWFAEALAAINEAPAPIIAVDIPSGIHGRTGAEMGIAVQAHRTATFVGRKAGVFTGRGAACAGDIVFDDLGAGPFTEGLETPYAQATTAADLASVLPSRPLDAHKGQNGHVLVVGGDRGMAGAARLAGEAAARSGAGLVSVATRPEHVPIMVGACPELMAHGIAEEADLAPLLERATLVALGPGLGQGEWGHGLWRACLAWGGPMVIDADGLNRLAAVPQALGRAILTPHPGEAARLLGGDWETAAIGADRFAAARALAEQQRATAVLKGLGTVVDDSARCRVVTAGTPGMASGGMGDVLTGVTAGVWAQVGGGPGPVAAGAAFAHARAGERAAVALGGARGLLASDLLAHLPAILAEGAE